MKKITIFTLLTSSLIADIPNAGRPNPGAFIDDNKEILESLQIQIKDMQREIKHLISLQNQVKVPDFEDEKFEKIRFEVQSINTRLQYLIWLVDHPLEDGDY